MLTQRERFESYFRLPGPKDPERERIILAAADALDSATADGEMTIGMKKEDVLQFELEAFTELINMINVYGMPAKKESNPKSKARKAQK